MITIPYAEDLSPEQRKEFTQRLLTLHQVLGESADENYGHSFIIRHGFDPDDYIVQLSPRLQHNTCGTAACAVGHAVWHHEKFPGLPVLFDHKDRPSGLQNFVDGGYMDDADVSNMYFGPGAWRYIFDAGAYEQEHGAESGRVTRAMAMKRIEDFVTQRLGCKLIE